MKLRIAFGIFIGSVIFLFAWFGPLAVFRGVWFCLFWLAEIFGLISVAGFLAVMFAFAYFGRSKEGGIRGCLLRLRNRIKQWIQGLLKAKEANSCRAGVLQLLQMLRKTRNQNPDEWANLMVLAEGADQKFFAIHPGSPECPLRETVQQEMDRVLFGVISVS